MGSLNQSSKLLGGFFLTYSASPNYQYYQEEGFSSLGSGAVESTIKQIGMRVKLSGAQWKIENVPAILSLRCAYLNGLLSP